MTQPIRYAKQKGSRRSYLALIALTWVISVAVSSPIAFGMNYTERRRLTPTLCTFYNSDFLICSSMASFYIPCLVMLVLYCKMFRSIRQMARRYQSNPVKSCITFTVKQYCSRYFKQYSDDTRYTRYFLNIPFGRYFCIYLLISTFMRST